MRCPNNAEASLKWAGITPHKSGISNKFFRAEQATLQEWLVLFSLFNGISTFMVYLMPK